MAEIDPAQDGQLQLKKRARRRLVGAVALAFLAVIVLPMVMDQEPKPLTQDIQIRIPSQEVGALPSTVVPALPSAASKIGTIPATPETKPEPPTVAPPLKPVEQTKPPAPETKPDGKPDSKPDSKPEAKPEQPKVASPPKSAPPKPVEQIKPPPPETKADARSEPSPEQWIVQLGAYQDQANVRLLLSKLKELGLPSYTEKVDTEQGPRTRVRGGPFATRRAAEKAQAQLKKISAGGPPGGIVAQKQ